MMKIVCVSHTSRTFFGPSGSVNSFEHRFKDGLHTLPPLETLPSIKESVKYVGTASLWLLDEEDTKSPTLRFLHHVSAGYTVQSAIIHNDFLYLYGYDKLDILNTDLTTHRTLIHPLIAGGHTVYPGEGDSMWLSSAAGNAALLVDIKTDEIKKQILMPACYGIGYAIGESTNLHTHSVSTDYQPTHLNSVFPYQEGLLITLLRQGVVGYQKHDGDYREIIRGLRGCHGAKINSLTNELYVSDTPTGIIWFINFHSGKIERRLQIDTKWLHDSEHINDKFLLAADGQHNALLVVNARNGDVVNQYDCSHLGGGVVFIRVSEVNEKWQKSIQQMTPSVSNNGSQQKHFYGHETRRIKAQIHVPSILNDFQLHKDTILVSKIPLKIMTPSACWAQACSLNVMSKIKRKYRGQYAIGIEIKIEVLQGKIGMGILHGKVGLEKISRKPAEFICEQYASVLEDQQIIRITIPAEIKMGDLVFRNVDSNQQASIFILKDIQIFILD